MSGQCEGVDRSRWSGAECTEEAKEKGGSIMTWQNVIVLVTCLRMLGSPVVGPATTGISTYPSPRGQMTANYWSPSGVAQRTQPGRMFDVRRYGARGDGQTDDTKAIQTLAQSLSPGDILFFGQGTYKITDTIKVGADDVVVRLEEAGLYMAGAVTAIQASANGITIWGGEISSKGQAVGCGLYGIDLSGDNCIVDGTHIHDIHASGVVSRGSNNIIRNIRVENVGWDMGLCRGGSRRTIWQDCWCKNVGRSAVACDSKAEDTQILRCEALNPGNTRFVNQQHNVWHFEDSDGGLVKDCTVRYTADHDYCWHTDTNSKAVLARCNGKEVIVDGLTVILEPRFDTTATITLLADYGRDTIPLRVSNMRIYNNTDEILSVALQGPDMEWWDWYVYGGLAIRQAGAASTVVRMQRLHIDGNDLPFDFYSQQYGYDPNGIITDCTFENIKGWAITGCFDKWKITNNVFRNVNGIALLAQSNNFARKSEHNVIASNLFDRCGYVLFVHGGTTTGTHANAFCGNTVSGRTETVYYGSFAGTSVYWQANVKAEDATWTTLAINNGFRLFDTLLSEYDSPPPSTSPR
jgi:hypothetical protein